MLIDTNIDILLKNEDNWIGILKDKIYPVYKAKENKKQEYFEEENGNIILLEDKFDNSQIINPFKKELIFILGINSIHELREIYKKKNKNSFIIVIEPNISFFNYVLRNKNLNLFQNKDILLFTDDKSELLEFLQPLLHNINIIALVNNITFYITNYYRKYAIDQALECIKIIKQLTRSVVMSMGNDVLDSLQGLEQNLRNIPFIKKSKNPEYLKNKFKDTPAILVAAGPSLNKNISEIKNAVGKAIIIAVDTILMRLLKEGIVPDFVCSVERIGSVYDYFYKDKVIPDNITLVGPPLLDSRILEEYKGPLLLPFRYEVNEYKWLQKALAIKGDIGIQMGLSCANVAFGLAMHLGCSPIIMTGQDLSYGENEKETHASGTSYDKEQKEKDDRYDDEVEGYFGGKVKTTHIWTTFKTWFENEIVTNHLKVINATEGGAKIYHTEQKKLKETIIEFCNKEIENVYEVIKHSPTYKIDYKIMKENFIDQYKYMGIFREKCLHYYANLDSMVIDSLLFLKKQGHLKEELDKIFELTKEIQMNELLMHNIQAILLRFLVSYNEIEDILKVDNYRRHRDIRIRFIGAVIVTVTKLEEQLGEVLKNEFNLDLEKVNNDEIK